MLVLMAQDPGSMTKGWLGLVVQGGALVLAAGLIWLIQWLVKTSSAERQEMMATYRQQAEMTTQAIKDVSVGQEKICGHMVAQTSLIEGQTAVVGKIKDSLVRLEAKANGRN